MNGLKFRIYSVVIVFLGLIFFPLINEYTGLIKDSENLENRKMAKKPPFDIEHLDPFPPEYEKYYNDNFTLRSTMVKNFNLFNLAVYKKSPFPDRVIIGNDGWLFLGYNDMDIYLGKNRFTEKELEDFRLELEYRRDYLAQRGCKLYFIIAPGKPNIYSEQVPYTFYRYNQQSWGEQLIAHLNRKSNLNVINLYPALRAKKDQSIYYKLDTHWNGLGAFYAANEFYKTAEKDVPGIKPMSLNDYEIKRSLKTDGNCSQILGYPKMLTDTDCELISKKPLKAKKTGSGVWELEGSKQPKLLISGDSFINWFAPFMTEQFGMTIYEFDFWEYKFNEELINFEKPDAYVLLIHEPLLRSMLSHQARLKQK